MKVLWETSGQASGRPCHISSNLRLLPDPQRLSHSPTREVDIWSVSCRIPNSRGPLLPDRRRTSPPANVPNGSIGPKMWRCLGLGFSTSTCGRHIGGGSLCPHRHSSCAEKNSAARLRPCPSATCLGTNKGCMLRIAISSHLNREY